MTEKFFKDLKNQAAEKISSKKGIIPLTNEKNEQYLKRKVCHICKKEFSSDNSNEQYRKVLDHCY